MLLVALVIAAVAYVWIHGKGRLRGSRPVLLSVDRVDTARFERLVSAGRAALGRGEAAAAADRFGEALAVWRGRVLADVAEVEPLALEAARLEELRLVAVEGHATRCVGRS